MTQRSSPIHKRISALRTPVALAFLAAATIHHLIMETASVEWRLASEILIYGVGAAVAAWVLLGWLARSVAVAERASEEQAKSAARLARRNRQIEALYTASRLLHGARSLQSVARPLLELAMRIAEAPAGALVLYGGDGGERGGEPRVITHRVAGEPEGEFEPFDDIRIGDPCLSCPDAPGCELPAGVRCLPIMVGPEVLGLLRLKDPAWGDTTRQSLDTLVREIIAACWAWRAEGRAISALDKVGYKVRSQEDAEQVLEGFVELICEALGASAGTLYRHDGDRYRLEAATGPAAVPAPASKTPASDAVWSDPGGRIVYARSAGGSLLALSFESLYPLRARDMGLLRVVVAQAEFLLQMTGTLSGLVWRERQRLAGELHDSLAQTLAYLNLQIRRAIDARNGNRDAETGAILDEISGVTLDAYEDIRRTIDDLRLYPRRGEETGAFLERIATNFAARERLIVDVDIAPGLRAPRGAVAELARFLQEALNNAAHHGRARRISVRLEIARPGYVFEVADDGDGFVPDEIPDLGRHGLMVMRERIQGLGGRFELHSSPGQGTTVRAHLPEAALSSVGTRSKLAGTG